MNIIGLSIALVLIPGQSDAQASEKYAIAAKAKLIVVGRLVNVTRIPWFDGWHIEGDLLVDEVMFGGARKAGSKLGYSFTCSCCTAWPPPNVDATVKNAGIWFLIPADQSSWNSAGSCSDPGWRPFEAKAAFAAFLRDRQKRH